MALWQQLRYFTLVCSSPCPCPRVPAPARLAVLGDLDMLSVLFDFLLATTRMSVNRNSVSS